MVGTSDFGNLVYGAELGGLGGDDLLNVGRRTHLRVVHTYMEDSKGACKGDNWNWGSAISTRDPEGSSEGLRWRCGHRTGLEVSTGESSSFEVCRRRRHGHKELNKDQPCMDDSGLRGPAERVARAAQSGQTLTLEATSWCRRSVGVRKVEGF